MFLMYVVYISFNLLNDRTLMKGTGRVLVRDPDCSWLKFYHCWYVPWKMWDGGPNFCHGALLNPCISASKQHHHILDTWHYTDGDIVIGSDCKLYDLHPACFL